MSLNHNPTITTTGLQLYFDKSNNKNFNGGSNLIISPTNLTNSPWVAGTGTPVVTSNVAIAPDGTKTACSIINGGAVSLWAQTFVTSTCGTGMQYSSIYAKAFTSNVFTLNSYYVGDTEVNITFTLSGNGTTDTPTKSIIKNVDCGWYLCTIFTPAVVNAGTTFAYRIWPAGRGVSITTGNYFWGPSLSNSLFDLSGNNNIFTVVNNPDYSSANGGSLVFNGTTNYVTMPENLTLNSQTISIGSWIKPTLTAQSGFIFEKGIVNSQYGIFLENNGTFYFRTQGLSTVDLTFTTATYITAGQWAHVVCTYGKGTKSIYVNGVLVAQQTLLTGTIPTNTSGCSIGAYGGYSGAKSYYFNGSIANLKVYNIVLTAPQVQQNFISLKGKFL